MSEADFKGNEAFKDEIQERVLSNVDVYGFNLFADTTEAEYDGYQQAWRYLGWYVACGTPSDRYNQEEGSHEKSHDSNEGRWQGNNYCQRYLMWAGYVDLNYQGGGIGEYQYYNPYGKYWDQTACNKHGNGRCAYMDCHDPDTTTWTLMGVFKEASFFGNDAFFEQLFKHEGTCLWNDEDIYDFMSGAREKMWPQGCVETGYCDDGTCLYIDLKPTPGGNMTLGLYTDYICKTEYIGGYTLVDSVAKNMGLMYSGYIAAWNNAMEVYKVCQPCRTYNLKASVNNYDDYYNKYNNDDKYAWGNPDDDQYNYDPNGGYFWCSDDADYNNVNQCMKFRTHAELEVATWDDLVTATNQGGIMQVNVGGTIFGSEEMSYQQVINYHQMLYAQDKEERAKEKLVEQLKKEAMPWHFWGHTLVLVGAAAVLGSVLLVIVRTLAKMHAASSVDVLDDSVEAKRKMNLPLMN
jgi:hypothetical protein